MKQVIVIVFVAFSLIQCSQLALGPKEYVRWVQKPENGFLKSSQDAGVEFELQYKPVEFIIANENRKEVLSSSYYESRKNALGDLYYFTLSLKSGEQDLLLYNAQDEQEYIRRVNYFALEFQEDIKMVVGTDTFPCLMYQFENTYGVAPYVRMSLAFTGTARKAHESKPLIILVNDRTFGKRLIRFEYEPGKLNNSPSIISE